MEFGDEPKMILNGQQALASTAWIVLSALVLALVLALVQHQCRPDADVLGFYQASSA